MKSFYFFLFFLLISSCANQLVLEKRSFKIVDEFSSGHYWINTEKNKDQNLAIVLPDNLDSINWEENILIRTLKKKNYRILIPEILGDSESLKMHLDSRKRRINNLNNLHLQLSSTKEIDSSAKVLLIGFGEGAYIVPYLANHLAGVNQFFMINAALGSPLSEFELLVGEKNKSILNHPKLRYFGIENMDELKTIIKEVKNHPNYNNALGNKTNFYWNEYYQHPTDPDLAITAAKGTIILSEDYPLISDNSKTQLKFMIETNPLSQLALEQIKGNGDFREKDQILQLQKIILEKLN
tara:strand:- start:68686 stop:69573 length:888 start_codon:yes stop_codon:yes gene_type:complete